MEQNNTPSSAEINYSKYFGGKIENIYQKS